MHKQKYIGNFFVFAAGAGILFCLYSLFQVWRYQPVVTQALTNSMELFVATLETTQDGLVIVGQVVQTTTEDIALFQSTVHTMTLTIEDTTQILDSLTGLTGTDLPATISAAQTSLESAQKSALLIDDILTALTSIPFLRMTPYKPAVPLNVALADISDSLDPLTPTLTDISTNLVNGMTNLDALETELQTISETTQVIGDSLDETQTTITTYQAIVTDLKARAEATQLAIPVWTRTTAWILTFLLVSLLFAQFGLGAQGLEMLRVSRVPIPDTDQEI